MKYTFQLSESNVVEAYKVLWALTFYQIIFGSAIFVLSILIGVYVNSELASIFLFSMAIGVVIAIALRYLYLIPQRAKAIYRTTPPLRTQHYVEIQTDNLKYGDDTIERLIPWKNIFAFREAGDFVLLRVGFMTHILIPKKSSSGELETADIKKRIGGIIL